MDFLDSYINKDVVKHFAQLINDLNINKFSICIFSSGILETLKKYELLKLLPDSISILAAPGIVLDEVVNNHKIKALSFLDDEKTILTVKKIWIETAGTNESLQDLIKEGEKIKIVDDILGAMTIASKKRRNNVIFPAYGYEDEALITAAGLAKSKTVGFRRFYVLQNHNNSTEVVKAIANSKNDTYFMLPLKTGLNTGNEKFTEVPLLYNSGVVFSGYQAMEIMQSIYILAKQFSEKKPKVVFQRTKEVTEEVITRARWMIEEVFEYEDFSHSEYGIIKNGKMKIKEKYEMFDAEKLGI